MDAFMEDIWQSEHERQRAAGNAEAYRVDGEPQPAGQSANIMVRWTGGEQDRCITVQVNAAGQVSVISDYERCAEQGG